MNQTIRSQAHDAAACPACCSLTFTPADRIVLAVDHHAEQARRSARVTSWGEFRARVLRRNRQVAFSRAWGLR